MDPVIATACGMLFGVVGTLVVVFYAQMADDNHHANELAAMRKVTAERCLVLTQGSFSAAEAEEKIQKEFGGL